MPQLYESIFILRPSLTDEDSQKVLEKVKSIVEKSGGSIERLENWGKKKLAYEITGEKKGIYVQLQFQGGGTAVTELERVFRLDDAIVKFLTVKISRLGPPVGGIEGSVEPEHGRV
jgi:small subunit ribosomal protein S6